MTGDLVEWLRLQLDDDERVAREAADNDGNLEWRVTHGTLLGQYTVRTVSSRPVLRAQEADSAAEVDGGAYSHRATFDPAATSEHAARWDPARVLREVQAKRKILDEHHRIEQRGLWHKGTGYETEFIRAMCVLIGDDEDQGGSRWRYREHAEWPCRTVLFLAAIYSDRPGYREEWRPGDTPPDVNPA